MTAIERELAITIAEMEEQERYCMPKCYYCNKRFKVLINEGNRGYDYGYTIEPMITKPIKYCKNCRHCGNCQRQMSVMEFERCPLTATTPHCIECKLDELLITEQARTSPQWSHSFMWINRQGVCGEVEVYMEDEYAKEWAKRFWGRNSYMTYKLIKMNYDPNQPANYESWTRANMEKH